MNPTRPTIVSIQSQLVFGCAGNSAAVPLLQQLGARVHAVPTTLLSNTPNHPSIAGGPTDSATLQDLLDRLMERVPASHIDAVLTGYMATPDNAAVVAGFVERLRRAHPDVVYLCDPVIGDIDIGPYVDAPTAQAIAAHLVPLADIITPNLYEAGYLAKAPQAGPDSLLAALMALGPQHVAITGIVQDGDRLETVVRKGAKQWRVTTAKLPARPTGTGDLFAAAYLQALLRGMDAGRALKQAVNIVYRLTERAIAAGRADIDPAEPLEP